MSYAENTQVPAERSRAEIEKVLRRYGADGFMYGWDGPRAVIAFRAADRHIRFTMDMPDPHDARFHTTPGGRRSRSPAQAEKAWEQETRRLWRALALVIKAKLEAVESGITTFEHEFLAHIVMPDGRSVGEHVMPRIAEAYDSGHMPRALLPAPGGHNG